MYDLIHPLKHAVKVHQVLFHLINLLFLFRYLILIVKLDALHTVSVLFVQFVSHRINLFLMLLLIRVNKVFQLHDFNVSISEVLIL
jgi:hypothetical protein